MGLIKLDPQYQTVVQHTFNGETETDTTDTLFVSDARLDFRSGALYATIEKGSVVDGQFVQNLDSVEVTVNPDGTFVSNDGLWTGQIPSAPTLLATLKAEFDQFVLASGTISGKTV